MTTKALPSAKLANLIKEINYTFGHAKELILKAYNLAIQENRTPEEAKQLLLDNITVFKKTQIYAYLPPECKNPIKQKAGSVSHKAKVSVPKSEQDTEPEHSDPDNHSNLQLNEAGKYLAKLQAENTTLKREIENISNNVIPEALMKKDRQIGELQREKVELIRIHPEKGTPWENKYNQLHQEFDTLRNNVIKGNAQIEIGSELIPVKIEYNFRTNQFSAKIAQEVIERLLAALKRR